MSARARGLLLFVVKLALAGGMIAWLIASKTLTAEPFRPVCGHAWRLVACVALLLTLPFLGALRWQMLLRAQGLQISYLRVLHLGLVGVFFNSFGVGYVGGDVVKAYFAAVDQPRDRRAAAVTSVVCDRVVGLIGLLLLSLIVLVTEPGMVSGAGSVPILRLVALVIATVLCTLLATYALMLWKRIRNRMIEATGPIAKVPGGRILVQLLRAFAAYGESPGTLVCAVSISLLGHVINIAFMWQLAQSLEFPPMPALDFAFCIAVGIGATSVGLPLGIGQGQAAFAYLLFLYMGESGKALGAGLATLQQAMLLCCNLAVGLPAFLLVRKNSDRVRAVINEDAGETQSPSSAMTIDA